MTHTHTTKKRKVGVSKFDHEKNTNYEGKEGIIYDRIMIEFHISEIKVKMDKNKNY